MGGSFAGCGGLWVVAGEWIAWATGSSSPVARIGERGGGRERMVCLRTFRRWRGVGNVVLVAGFPINPDPDTRHREESGSGWFGGCGGHHSGHTVFRRGAAPEKIKID